MKQPLPICVVCRHYQPGATCAAFPDGIPDAIWHHVADHRQPFDGDGGVMFEANPELDPAEVADSLAHEDWLRMKFGLGEPLGLPASLSAALASGASPAV